jgi:hypothetical protein
MEKEKLLTMEEAKRVRAMVLYEERSISAPDAAETVERSVGQFYRILARCGGGKP